MSLVNKNVERKKHKDTRVTKDLFKRNPAIIDHFCKWYVDFVKEYPTLPDIDRFFNTGFKWCIWVWWDYFYDCGIDIAIGENRVYVFYHNREDSVYNYLSGRNEIFYIDSTASPSDRFESAIAELICRVELPF